VLRRMKNEMIGSCRLSKSIKDLSISRGDALSSGMALPLAMLISDLSSCNI